MRPLGESCVQLCHCVCHVVPVLGLQRLQQLWHRHRAQADGRLQLQQQPLQQQAWVAVSVLQVPLPHSGQTCSALKTGQTCSALKTHLKLLLYSTDMQHHAADVARLQPQQHVLRRRVLLSSCCAAEQHAGQQACFRSHSKAAGSIEQHLRDSRRCHCALAVMQARSNMMLISGCCPPGVTEKCYLIIVA